MDVLTLVSIIGTGASVIAAIVGSGFVLWRFIARDINAIRADLRDIRTDVRDIRTEASADRRALQSAMDSFRAEMFRLAERQSRLEGRLDERGSTAD